VNAQIKNPEQRIDLEDVKRHPWMRLVAVRIPFPHSTPSRTRMRYGLNALHFMHL
jgi:hypothetical protein